MVRVWEIRAGAFVAEEPCESTFAGFRGDKMWPNATMKNAGTMHEHGVFIDRSNVAREPMPSHLAADAQHAQVSDAQHCRNLLHAHGSRNVGTQVIVQLHTPLNSLPSFGSPHTTPASLASSRTREQRTRR